MLSTSCRKVRKCGERFCSNKVNVREYLFYSVEWRFCAKHLAPFARNESRACCRFPSQPLVSHLEKPQKILLGWCSVFLESFSSDDLFNTNASIVKGIAEQCSKSCPKACFLVISNPVNSTVPIFADVLKVSLLCCLCCSTVART